MPTTQHDAPSLFGSPAAPPAPRASPPAPAAARAGAPPATARRIPNRFVFTFGPYQIWVEDDRAPLEAASARALADAAAERGASCTRCTTASLIRTIRSHEPTAALCHDCANPDYDSALSTTRG